MLEEQYGQSMGDSMANEIENNELTTEEMITLFKPIPDRFEERIRPRKIPTNKERRNEQRLKKKYDEILEKIGTGEITETEINNENWNYLLTKLQEHDKVAFLKLQEINGPDFKCKYDWINNKLVLDRDMLLSQRKN